MSELPEGIRRVYSDADGLLMDQKNLPVGWTSNGIDRFVAIVETDPVTGGITTQAAGKRLGSTVFLPPSGDTSKATDSANLNALIAQLHASGGGEIQLLPEKYYAQDVTLMSGVSVVCPVLPSMNFNQICADLGFDPVNPFSGGARFVGTGTETVFTANTSNLVSAGPVVSPDDLSVSGVRLSGLIGVNIASLLTCGGIDHCGLAFSVLEHLYGFQIKGTFLDLTNIQHINGRNIKSVDCNHALRIAANHSACQPGNSMFSDLYNYSWEVPSGTYTGKNTDWAIKLECIDTGRAHGGNLLNYVTLNGRIQSNAFRDTVLDRTRANAHIVIIGAPGCPVNLCTINGTDLEGKMSYGIDARYTTGLRIKTDGWANYSDFVAGIKIRDSLQTIIESNSFDTTLWIDNASSVYLSGFLRYYANDNSEAAPIRASQYAKGIYTVFAECTNTSEPPTYTAIKTNGTTFLQLGSSNSYNMQLAESENVIRRSLIPMASSIQAQSGDRTWNRWEASRVLLSGSSSTQTLPVVDAKMDGVEFTFKSTNASSHTIATQSSQQIDGASTYALAAGGSVVFMASFEGTKWVVIGKY